MEYFPENVTDPVTGKKIRSKLGDTFIPYGKFIKHTALNYEKKKKNI